MEYIERERLLRDLNNIWLSVTPTDSMPDDDRHLAMVRCMGLNDAMDVVKESPAADVRPVVKAKWEDVHIDRPEIADLEVASMFCPHCNRWHNEVYHYGNPIEFANYCSFCGASMKEES